MTNVTPSFNFRVFFSKPAPETNAFDAGDAVATAASQVAQTMTTSNSIGFAEVSGIHSEVEVEEYREGGRNIGARRFPRWGRYPNLVFRRGVTDDPFLWDWWADVLSHSYTLQNGVATPRRNGIILLENQGHKATAGWFFTNGLPERLVGPGLNARASEVAIETLEISHEGLLRLPKANLPAS